jgi:hypothetical protein
VADVVIAVPKGALAILPGLAPENGWEPDEKWVLGEEFWEEPRWDFGSEFQRMLFGSVMRDERWSRKGIDRWGDDISLGGVQIAATGVDTERPGGVASGFPSGESERVVEELGNGGMGNGFGRREREEDRGVERGIRWWWVFGFGVGVGGEVTEREERGREVATKRVRLVGPVEAVGASGVLVIRVLGLLVVFEGLQEVLVVWVFFGTCFRWRRRRRRGRGKGHGGNKSFACCGEVDENVGWRKETKAVGAERSREPGARMKQWHFLLLFFVLTSGVWTFEHSRVCVMLPLPSVEVNISFLFLFRILNQNCSWFQQFGRNMDSMQKHQTTNSTRYGSSFVSQNTMNWFEFPIKKKKKKNKRS